MRLFLYLPTNSSTPIEIGLHRAGQRITPPKVSAGFEPWQRVVQSFLCLNQTSMETRNITNPAADMEGKIAAYFGNAKCNVAVALVGRIADATITYYDFKPVRIVRK